MSSTFDVRSSYWDWVTHDTTTILDSISERLDVNPVTYDISWTWEIDANVVDPTETIVDVKSDMSDDEWECPTNATEVPLTWMSEAITLPNVTSERDIVTSPVTVKFPNVAVSL